MIGLGTLVNVAAIVVGATFGILIKKGLPDRFKNIIIQAIGLSVVIIGISGALQEMYKVAPDGKLSRQYTMVMIFSLIIGGVTGELLDIEGKLEQLGLWFQKRFANKEGSFTQGFVTASLLFCVGAMAIVGSLEDGLTGNAETLFAKSVLDGVISIVFASTMGIGVAFSAIPILLYQGGITLLAGAIKPWLTGEVISQMSLVGSVIIIGVGTNLLEIKKIKVGNLLPAIFIPFVYYIILKILN